MYIIRLADAMFEVSGTLSPELHAAVCHLYLVAHMAFIAAACITQPRVIQS